MTKRLISSEADFQPQYKIHIGEKEIWHGRVPHSVYDKTLKLLYDGSRKLKSNKVTSFVDFTVKQNYVRGSYSSCRQMFINSQCKLETEGVNKVYSENYHHCHLVTSLQNQMQCCFCERSICQECTVTCARCEKEYCKTCSMCIYSTDFDYICLECC